MLYGGESIVSCIRFILRLFVVGAVSCMGYCAGCFGRASCMSSCSRLLELFGTSSMRFMFFLSRCVFSGKC